MQDTQRPGWTRVWQDEFDGDALDRTKWDFDLGNGFYDYRVHQWVPGWGNEELQYCTGDPENVQLRDSCVFIRAVKAPLHGCGYTSARLKTKARNRVSVELAPGGHQTWQGPVTLMHYTVDLRRPIELAANDAANPRWFIDIIGLTDTPWAEGNWWQGSGPSHNSFQFIRADGYTFRTLPEARAIRLTSAVPEPASSALLLAGLLGLGCCLRRRADQNTAWSPRSGAVAPRTRAA